MDAKLLYYPDPRLRDVANPVGEITQEVRDLVPLMFEVMYKARGIGLAGPQIGCESRIVVANIVYDPEEGPTEEVYINPKITGTNGNVKEEEGCLSLPGLYAAIDRYDEVTVEYTTLEGEAKTVTVGALHSRLFQHEIDHLDAILIIDKMSSAEKKRWTPLLQELEEDFAADRPLEREPSHKEGAL